MLNCKASPFILTVTSAVSFVFCLCKGVIMWLLNFIISHCIFLFFARPVYNREKLITEAICLIVNQDYDNFELIITDNASMDGTKRFYRDFAACGKHKSYVRNERNRGAGPNHNLGFKLSSRECFKWCAADERISRDFLSARGVCPR